MNELMEFPIVDPKNMREIDLGMSNFDLAIDEGFAEALKLEPGKVCGRHSAWSFNGKVYFYDGKFHQQIWVYGAPVKTITADSLEELMSDANREFGND